MATEPPHTLPHQNPSWAACVEMYYSPFCGYCQRAIRLFERHGVAYEGYNVLTTASMRDDMAQRAHGRRTVPQIFINGHHIGGSDELHQLEQNGQLQALLRKAPHHGEGEG
ncbi:MAG: glutaredoxin 3 [Alphaproteobacteria bacterium GM7ARS4]|nr:glutaredoxin 3 [Alphaproteobacteria bacterium GM7ARS4]